MPNHFLSQSCKGPLQSFSVVAGAVALLTISLPGFARAQQTGVQTPPAKSPAVRVTVADVAARITKATGVLVLADSTVNGQPVLRDTFLSTGSVSSTSTDLTSDPSDETLRTVADQVARLVKTLPNGTISARLYLPVTGRSKNWTGDEVAGFGVAGAQLFGQFGAPVPEGFVEIMGQTVPKDKASTYIAGLHLKPVFLISNPSRLVGGVEPWSPVSRGQWQQMTRDQQKQYGQQQAATIMNMPPEQRDQVIREMKQMDRFFDSVKDPLEKLIGHDL